MRGAIFCVLPGPSDPAKFCRVEFCTIKARYGKDFARSQKTKYVVSYRKRVLPDRAKFPGSGKIVLMMMNDDDDDVDDDS